MKKNILSVFVLLNTTIFADIKIDNCILQETKKSSKETSITLIDLKKVSKLEFVENTFIGKTTLSLYTQDPIEPIFRYIVKNRPKTKKEYASLKMTRTITSAVNTCIVK